ncbi:ankyrin containing protein [Coprinopsis cinerea okayama7|uniref:Ankyrin containing protein n=1 Tax=Coprinopsis cinerea (strain Okayama-7 / 130 / ATCC MYA-4618 / FGSC 9003) TaxID=240176 RepID=A8NAF8_COPC7|nr:ankyrin containing protein [Coprinopsis cinerea okayama7\|eukprot:XP_001831810.2 ankyrin containing protein [Coprinopsis cinerea okayama7\
MYRSRLKQTVRLAIFEDREPYLAMVFANSLLGSHLRETLILAAVLSQAETSTTTLKLNERRRYIPVVEGGRGSYYLGFRNASRAIHDLEKHQKTSTKKVCVVFAYCRYTEPLTVNDILEALVKQFLECDPSLVAVVDPLYSRYSLDDSARPTQEELLELVKQLETHFDIVYYVIDGLDEARMDTQFDLIEAINNLRGRFSLTSRPLKSLAMDLRNARFYPITANASDILLLVAKKITRNPGFRRLLEQNHLTQELVVKILAKSSGMFLHAALQIEMIHKCVDVSCVKKNLSRFPERLQDLYDMAMDRINDQIPHNAMLANHVLLWLVFGCAALTLTDLQYALSATYDGDVQVDADGILSLCCGLVHIEKTIFVRLIHFTAKDALGPILKEKTFPNPHGILFRATTKRLMEFNILNNAKPEKDLFERLLSDHPMLRYSYDHWSSHALECMSDPVYAAEVMQVVKLCVSYPCMDLGWDGMEHLHPLHVVARYGFHDLVDEVVTEVAKGDLSLRTQGNLGATALILASEYGHVEVVNRLLQFNRWTMIRSVIVGQSRPGMHLITAQVNLRDNLGGTALMRAASSGRLEAVQRLLDDPEIDVNLQDHDGRTALMHASPKAIVPLLERQDIQVNIQDNKGYTALMKASEYGGTARIIVQHLVQHKDIQINLRNQKGDTALMCAAAKGRSRNVKLLLQHEDIDVNAESGGWTALMLAAKNGDEETVRALLDFEATDVNARTKIYGSTALMIATIQSHPGRGEDSLTRGTDP